MTPTEYQGLRRDFESCFFGRFCAELEKSHPWVVVTVGDFGRSNTRHPIGSGEAFSGHVPPVTEWPGAAKRFDMLITKSTKRAVHDIDATQLTIIYLSFDWSDLECWIYLSGPAATVELKPYRPPTEEEQEKDARDEA